MGMFTCSTCLSFIPATKAACPNCGAPSSSRALRNLMALGGGAAISVTLSACYGLPVADRDAAWDAGSGDASCADVDGDGRCGALDCDEANPAVYRGAPETVGDGIDSDCGGTDGVDP